jgi:hypothetical protein
MSSEGEEESDETAYRATPLGRSGGLDDFT